MTARIKILFVGFNYRYMNPTASLLPAALSRTCAVYYYGPGFVPDVVLDQGIDRYVDSIGGVDVVVATKDCAGNYRAEDLSRFLHRNAAAVTDHVTPQTLADIKGFLRRNIARVIVSFLDVDLFALQEVHLSTFLEHGRYFIALGSEAFALSHPDLESEPYVQAKRKRGLELGLFRKFADQHVERLIRLNFFVAESEFSWGGLATRPHDVFVPGARYYRRARIAQYLAQLNSIAVARDRYRILFQLADKARLNPYANYYLVHLYNLAFQRLLSRSKVCVTDGGLIGFTIRKFFEIPASGALLVCWPTTDFERLGFIDQANCVCVANESQVAEVVRAVAADSESFQHIASAGR